MHISTVGDEHNVHIESDYYVRELYEVKKNCVRESIQSSSGNIYECKSACGCFAMISCVCKYWMGEWMFFVFFFLRE